MPDSITAPVTIIRNEITAPITLAGRDAYQLAVADGFVGTREEWLASLKGDDGAPGTTSWNGITDKPSAFAPSAHKSSHATGGSDALAPSDIGAVATNDSRLSDARDASYQYRSFTDNITLTASDRFVEFIGDAKTFDPDFPPTVSLPLLSTMQNGQRITIVDGSGTLAYGTYPEGKIQVLVHYPNQINGNEGNNFLLTPYEHATYIADVTRGKWMRDGSNIKETDYRLSDARTPTASGLASTTHAATSKTTPVDADEFGFWDSVASAWKKASWANLKATLKSYFDGLYAMLSGYQTASLTAVKGGRYHIKGSLAADGTVAITDPSSPAPAAGDIYKCVIVSGYVRIGGTDYYKSRHEITRHYTGSAWETLAPYYSEAPDYAAGIRSTARSNLGAGAVGDTLFTAATLAAARSAIGFASSSLPSQFDATTNTLAAITGLDTFSLEANTFYRIDYLAYLTYTTGGYQIAASFSNAIYDPASHAASGNAQNTDTSSSYPNRVSSTLVRLLNKTTGSSANNYPAEGFWLFLTGSSPTTLTLQAAQASTGTPSGTMSLLKMGVSVRKL